MWLELSDGVALAGKQRASGHVQRADQLHRRLGVQGSFTTPTVGATCKQYATSSLAWTIGLGPEVGTPIPVDGQTINFLISVPQSTFHGAGKYSGNVVSGVTVGLDTFAGINSTMKLDSDGSGNATFTNYIGTTSSVTESGTITWTCSQ